MLVTYLRSSSFNCHETCPLSFFIEYNLGIRGKSNIKADMGTCVHKVMEVLAINKKGLQDKAKECEDDIYGKFKPTKKPNINKIIEKVYAHYSKAFSHHNWTEDEFAKVKLWVEKTLSFGDGAFDPLNQNIYSPEMEFDIAIDEPWSNGEYFIKGTMDLVVAHGDGLYEIVDYKTGRRLNWGTGEEKTFEKLQQDPQLKLYHYAATKLIPDAKEIMVTIYFINDGGPFTMSFGPAELESTVEMLRQKFEEIKATKLPKQNKSWKCSKLCNAGKTTFENTHVAPIIEGRNGKTTPQGQIMTKCEQTYYAIQKYGIDFVQENYKMPNHNVGFYKAPGSV